MGNSVRRVSASEILASPGLLAEYAAECSVPDPTPQGAVYEALESAGRLACFAIDSDSQVVGFVSVLTSETLHHGKKAATIESLFVQKPYRTGGTADSLLTAAEQYCAVRQCDLLTYMARIGSALETVLSRRRGLERTHSQFTRWL